MITWTDLPEDIRRIIISMGNEICAHELYNHKKEFDHCLFDIRHNVYTPNKTVSVRYWIRSENIS